MENPGAFFPVMSLEVTALFSAPVKQFWGDAGLVWSLSQLWQCVTGGRWFPKPCSSSPPFTARAGDRVLVLVTHW